jgi:hypothetical protein
MMDAILQLLDEFIVLLNEFKHLLGEELQKAYEAAIGHLTQILMKLVKVF